MTQTPETIFFAEQHLSVNTEVIDLINAPVVSLDPLGALPNLRVLRLGDTNRHAMSGGMLLDLAALSPCTCLEVLELPEQNIRSAEALKLLPTLQSVDLSFTRVFDLAPFEGLDHLRSLKLRHTPVESVAPLADLPALVHLDIAHTAVSDIAPLGSLPALETLDLRATGVTDLAALVGVTSLREVTIQRLELESKAVEELRRARPDLAVIE